MFEGTFSDVKAHMSLIIIVTSNEKLTEVIDPWGYVDALMDTNWVKV